MSLFSAWNCQLKTIGEGAAALYRYLKSHEELVELMIDTVSGEYDCRPPAKPRPASYLGRGPNASASAVGHGWASVNECQSGKGSTGRSASGLP